MYSDAAIGARSTTIFDDAYGLYGAKRIAANLKEDTAYTPVRCEFLVPVFWGLGTVVFRVVGTGPRGTSARAVSLSRLGWSGRWLYACRSLRYGFGGRC